MHALKINLERNSRELRLGHFHLHLLRVDVCVANLNQVIELSDRRVISRNRRPVRERQEIQIKLVENRPHLSLVAELMIARNEREKAIRGTLQRKDSMRYCRSAVHALHFLRAFCTLGEMCRQDRIREVHLERIDDEMPHRVFWSVGRHLDYLHNSVLVQRWRLAI